MVRTNKPDASASELIARDVEREIAEVEAAIALVRSGRATDVSIANLRFGEEVLRQVRARGADRGVVLEPLPWPEDTGADINVRRIDD
jgi:hypothetical protein